MTFKAVFLMLIASSWAIPKDKISNDNHSVICSLPSEPGLCEAAIPRFFYNKTTGKCESFTYGGCSGNKNNFEKISECQRQCEN